MTFSMPRPPASKYGPRKVVGPTLTEEQRKLVAATGVSKQQIVTRGIALVERADLTAPAAYGTGRKVVLFRMAPEIFDQFMRLCGQWSCSQGQLVEACARALLKQKQ